MADCGALVRREQRGESRHSTVTQAKQAHGPYSQNGDDLRGG
jgi:hypothetical protein